MGHSFDVLPPASLQVASSLDKRACVPAWSVMDIRRPNTRASRPPLDDRDGRRSDRM